MPASEFIPDAGLNRTAALVRCANVVPVHGNYAVFPGTEQVGARTATPPYGAAFINGKPYVGFDGRVLVFDTSAGPPWTSQDVVDGSGWSTIGEFGWQFAGYGAHTILVDGVNEIQLHENGTGLTVDLIAEAGLLKPQAALVSPMWGQLAHVLFGNMTVAGEAKPTRVWWTATDNHRILGATDTKPGENTDYQDLQDDLGPVTGLARGNGFQLILKERGLVRMDWPPAFSVVDTSEGTRFPNSVVEVGSDVYFWGSKGPAVSRDGSAAISLGLGKISRALFSSGSELELADGLGPRAISSALDRATGLIFTVIKTTNSPADTDAGDIILVYSPTEDRFSFLESLTAASVGAAETHQIFNRSADYERPWLPGRDLLFLQKYETGTEGYELHRCKEGLSREPVFTTGFMALDDLTSKIQGIRPIYDLSSQSSGDVACRVTVRSKNNLFGTPQEKSLERRTPHDWFPLLSNAADFHQIEIRFLSGSVDPGNVVNFRGIELSFSPGGVASQ